MVRYRVVLGQTKIDWLELQRGIESRCARSARRRALLSQSQRQGGKRVLLVLLQLRHSRRRIWDAGHGPCWVNDDCFPRVISHDDPSIPGRDLKCAVRRVFVRYGAIIQEGIGPARSLDFAYGGERQCGQRQDADPAILRGASDPCERGIDLEATGLRYLAGNEREGAFAETKQGRIRDPVANELVQHHAGVIRKLERGAIGEGDADGAIESSLDRVVPVDRITDFDLGNNAAGANDRDSTGHRLDLADCLGRRGPYQLGAAANSATLTWRIAGATEHATPPCVVGCLVMRRYTTSRSVRGEYSAKPLKLCLQVHESRRGCPAGVIFYFFCVFRRYPARRIA